MSSVVINLEFYSTLMADSIKTLCVCVLDPSIYLTEDSADVAVHACLPSDTAS